MLGSFAEGLTMKWDPRKLDAEWPFDIFATDFALDAESTALIVVDMQGGELSIDENSPLAIRYPQIVDFWNRRIEQVVIPNIRRLIDFFRARNLKTVFTRNGNVTSSGDEMTERLRLKTPPGGPRMHRVSDGYQIDERLAPTDADLVVDKLTSGGFTAGFLDHALRNMGVRSVVITGMLTDACVLGTARPAAELGYKTLICEDACGTFTQRAHDEALLMHARMFGRIGTTDEVISELTAGSA